VTTGRWLGAGAVAGVGEGTDIERCRATYRPQVPPGRHPLTVKVGAAELVSIPIPAFSRREMRWWWSLIAEVYLLEEPASVWHRTLGANVMQLHCAPNPSIFRKLIHQVFTERHR
jgi:hypothetical protein